MAKRSARGPTQRQLRVGELVRHAIAEILRRGKLSGLDLAGTVVTVSEVRMSPDLKVATVFVLPLGGGDADRTVTALDDSRKQLRHQVARRLDLRYAPDLRFRTDGSFDEGDRIDALLRLPKVRRDLEPEDGDSPSGDRD